MTKKIISELSIDKLKAYKKSAASDREALGDKLKDKFDKDTFKKYTNRRNGQDAAVRLAGKKVLAGEDVEQIDELSKSTVSSYALKSLADRHVQGKKWTEAQRKANRIKRPGDLKQDHDYGETDADFEDRKARVVRNKKKAEANRDTSYRKMTNREVGLSRAGKRLAKEETEGTEVMSDKNLMESIISEDVVSIAETVDKILRAKIDVALFGEQEEVEETEENENEDASAK